MFCKFHGLVFPIFPCEFHSGFCLCMPHDLKQGGIEIYVALTLGIKFSKEFNCSLSKHMENRRNDLQKEACLAITLADYEVERMRAPQDVDGAEKQEFVQKKPR